MIGAGALVFAVWGYAITKARAARVELNPKLLGFVLGESEEKVQKAISWLEQADPKSRCEVDGGRRLVKEGTYQYFLPSWEKYNRIRNAKDLREYNRVAKQRERDRNAVARERETGKPGKAATSEGAAVRAFTAAPTKAEADRAMELGTGTAPDRVFDPLKDSVPAKDYRPDEPAEPATVDPLAEPPKTILDPRHPDAAGQFVFQDKTGHAFLVRGTGLWWWGAEKGWVKRRDITAEEAAGFEKHRKELSPAEREYYGIADETAKPKENP